MGKTRTRESNPNWRGGRSVASNGYVLVRVGVGHHLADVRGYAYEHRLVAEEMLGRRLLATEIVHHRDGNKRNNARENLQVVPSIAHHLREHAKNRTNRAPGEPNPDIACSCGCGATFPKFDRSGRPRRFVSGHNARSAA